MYPVSSQKKNWTFTDEAEIDSLRRMANERFIERFGGAKTVRFYLNVHLTVDKKWSVGCH